MVSINVSQVTVLKKRLALYRKIRVKPERIRAAREEIIHMIFGCISVLLIAYSPSASGSEYIHDHISSDRYL
jgi:hypothetical protein